MRIFCNDKHDFFLTESPSLQDSITAPVVSATGRSILLTCVVRRLGNNTLIWKYGTNTILTAGSVRITADPRFNVLHDEGIKVSKYKIHLML